MSTEAINDLRRCVKQYRAVDDELREMNKAIHSKREDRKIIEMEMSDLVKLPQFAGIDKVKIDDDGSTIKIGRPGTYNKPWSLSKKELKALLESYFVPGHRIDAESCFNFIVQERQQALVGKDYDFTRVIPDE
jgi:hypothetical protein